MWKELRHTLREKHAMRQPGRYLLSLLPVIILFEERHGPRFMRFLSTQKISFRYYPEPRNLLEKKNLACFASWLAYAQLNNDENDKSH